MSKEIKELKPKRVFHYFREISKIPRCSFHEEKISTYLKEFGENLGLETLQDEALNVIIKKPGTDGYEHSPTIVLQGHMDMVCEKEENSKHDFSKDPLELIIDGDYLKAKGTTLGADNGIAVAMSLALLESKDIPHPPLEVIFTTNEESGMYGAIELNPKHIEGKTLINMDSEEEGTILVSCAGGAGNTVTVPVEWNTMEPSDNRIAYAIRPSGLQGGHSGVEIHQERGNAIKIIARILDMMREECQYGLAHIEGGSKHNAIPRTGEAIVVIKDRDEDNFKRCLSEWGKQIQNELEKSEPDFGIVLERVEGNIEKILKEDSLNRILAALLLIPSGVQSMSMDMEDLVESSDNLAIVKTLENEITIEISIRSSKESLKTSIGRQIKAVADLVDGIWEVGSTYPAWEYKSESPIREVFKKVYKEQYGEEINIQAIHAGLECGIFAEKFVDMDMISFGPNMYDVHTPKEKLSIESTVRTYELLLNVLKNIK